MDLLQFSHPHKHTAYQCKVSPDGNYVGNAIDNRLVIRSNANELVIMHVYESPEKIEWVEWSPDSQFIATANFKGAVIRVWSVTDTQWHGEFKDASFGLTRVCWSPDSIHVIACSELRLTVWSHADQSVTLIDYPKFGGGEPKGIECSPHGKYVAIAYLAQGKDHIGIYSPRFHCLERFQTDTSDLANMQWSPDGSFLAVWDSCLYYKLLIYKPNGTLIKQYMASENDEDGLGIKSVTWSPGGELLAIGSYDKKICILNTTHWNKVCALEHPEVINSYHLTMVYEEVELPRPSVPTLDARVAYRSRAARPYQIPILRPEHNNPNPKIGIGLCQFSGDGKYLASRNDSMPHTLWIWDICSLSCCAIIQQRHPIRQVEWCPSLQRMLVMTCGNENLYVIHQNENADFVVAPCKPSSDFGIRKIAWSSHGKSLILMDHNLYCLSQIKMDGDVVKES